MIPHASTVGLASQRLTRTNIRLAYRHEPRSTGIKLQRAVGRYGWADRASECVGIADQRRDGAAIAEQLPTYQVVAGIEDWQA